MTVVQFLITFIVSYGLGYMTVLCVELHGIRSERRIYERRVRTPYITLDEYVSDMADNRARLNEISKKIDDICRKEQIEQ